MYLILTVPADRQWCYSHFQGEEMKPERKGASPWSHRSEGAEFRFQPRSPELQRLLLTTVFPSYHQCWSETEVLDYPIWGSDHILDEWDWGPLKFRHKPQKDLLNSSRIITTNFSYYPDKRLVTWSWLPKERKGKNHIMTLMASSPGFPFQSGKFP